MPEGGCGWYVAVVSLLVSVSAQYITMTGPIPINLGSSAPYTLICAATSTSGAPPNVTWTSYPAGSVGNQTTSGSTTSRSLTLSSPVVLSYAGLYVCNASANGVSRTASYAFNITVALSLSPPITVTSTPPLPNYQGSLLTLTCTFGISTTYVGLEPTSILWVGPTQQPLVPDGHVTIQTSNTTTSGVVTIYTSTLTISALSRKDGGPYNCTPTIGPKVPSPYVINYIPLATGASSLVTTISDLPLGTTISPSMLQSSPNSSFQINCTATKPTSVPLPFVFSWSWSNGYNSSAITFNSSGVALTGGTTFVMTQPPGVTNSTPNATSTLTVSQPPPGVYTYQCDVRVYVPVDGPVNQTAAATVSVPGPPNQPTFITAKYVSMDTISIMWTVPFIVYTQESYVIRYGSAPGNLSQSSTPVNGSAYLNVIGGQFGVNLTGLVPSSMYYFTIMASNTEGTTSTPVMNIAFFSPFTSTTPPVSSSSLSSSSSTPSPLPSASNAKYAAFTVLVVLVIGAAIAVIIIAIVARRRKSTTGWRPPTVALSQVKKGQNSTTCKDSVQPASPVYEEIKDEKHKESHDAPPPSITLKPNEPQTTAIPLADLDEIISKARFKHIFEALHSEQDNNTSSHAMNNSTKNRYKDLVPYDSSIVRLPYEKNYYINASFIDGYNGRPNAYIAAQAPLENTVEDFWRMVWEFKSMTIVMLCRLDEDRVVQYWPMRPGETLMYGKMAVTLTENPDSSAKDGITVYKLELKEEKPLQAVNEVSLHHYTTWPEGERPENDEDFLTFCSKIHSLHRSPAPMIVMCNDGMGRTGTFITIHAMMEMADREGEVDFIQFINSSRARCPHFIRCAEHVRLCYETLSMYQQHKV